MMTKTLSVSAIKDGSVIDHIPAGQAIRILKLLNAFDNKQRITIGLNLKSKSLGLKDLIKIENRVLTDNEINEIATFAPKATVSFIQDFEVHKKLTTKLPEIISGIFICPNANCITRTEPVTSCFYVEDYGKRVKLNCKYCEKQFERDQIAGYTV